MEVEFDLTPEDYQAFARYHRKLRRVPTKHLLIAIAGCLGILVMTVGGGLFLLGPLGVYRVLGVNRGEGVLSLYVGLLFGWVGASLAQRWWQGRVYRGIWIAACQDPRSEWASRDVRVILSPDQLCTATRVSTDTYRWPVVWRIVVTPDHAFLYLTGEMAILIPRRAFRDAPQFEEFIALARQYQQGPGEKSTGIVATLPPEQTGIVRRQDS